MQKIIGFILEYPKSILALILAITAGFAFFIPSLSFNNSVESFIIKNDPDLITFQRFTHRFGSDETVVIAIKPRHSRDIFDKHVLHAIQRITEKVGKIKYVARVTSLANAKNIKWNKDQLEMGPLLKTIPESGEGLGILRKDTLNNPLYMNNLISKDGKTTAIIAYITQIKGDQPYRKKVVEEIEAVLENESTDGLDLYLSGIPVIKVYLTRYVQKDLILFFPLVLLLIGTISLILFTNWKGTLFSQLAIWITVVWALGLFALFGKTLNIVTSLFPLLILCIAVADVLHIIARYYEEVSATGDKKESLRRTFSYLAIPCLLTSITTAVGFSSLGISKIIPIKDFGLFASAGIVFAFLVAFSFVPTVLLFFGQPSRVPYQANPGRKLLDNILAGMAMINERKKGLVVSICLVALVIAIFGIFKLEVDIDFLSFFRKNSNISTATRFIDHTLGGVVPFNIAITGKGKNSLQEPKVLAEIEKIQEYLSTRPSINKVESLLDYLKLAHGTMNQGDPQAHRIPSSREGIAQYFLLYSAAGMDKALEEFVNYDYSAASIRSRISEHGSAKQIALVKEVRDFIHQNFGSDLQVDVTGTMVLYTKMADLLLKSQINSLILCIGVIFFTFIVSFRSFKIGLVSLIPSVIPVIFNLGMMGWLGIPLNAATALVSSIALGLAVDNAIHFIFRFQEELKLDTDYTKAIHRTLMSSSCRANIFTAIILFFGFGVLTLSNFAPTIYFGLLTGSLMVTSLLANLLLVPVGLMIIRPKFKLTLTECKDVAYYGPTLK